MEDLNIGHLAAESTPETTPTVELGANPPRRKGRKPGPKPAAKTNRTVEELEDIAPAKMSDNEKNQYITYCRAIIGQKTAQLQNLDETARKVFDRGSTAERNYTELKDRVERDMQLIRSGVTIMAESIINHTYGGK
jgi:hypothetical protein